MEQFKLHNSNKLYNVNILSNSEKDIGVDPKVVEDIIKNCDKNGDGMIDYKEFLANISQINI